ncbi:MAG TPA: hypothetical protein VEA58_08550 [Anaerovoracaceae bacterium]|nr:hypothetical protein [Anaerovoracaceae bacterium]
MELMKLIEEGNWHVFVCGLTQSGKSYFSHRAMLGISVGVLYMNVQGEKVPRGFVTVYANRIEPDQLIEMLRDGVKINLVFSDTRKALDYFVGTVLNMLMDAGFDEDYYIYIGLEECHLYRGYSKEIADYVSTSGLKKGIRLISISQRPATCSKTIYSLAFAHYIFFISEADREYMKSKGIDYEGCKPLWGDPKSHKYVYFDGYTLEGRPAI